MVRGFGGIFELLHRPLLSRSRVIVNGGGCEAVKECVIGGVHGYQLSLQVCRELGDLQAGILYDAFDLVGVCFAFGGLLKVDNAAVPAGQLNADIAVACGPFADGGEPVEWRLVAEKLRQEYSWPFYSRHNVLFRW